MEENIVLEKTNTERMEYLLKNVGVIQKKYDDLAKITGENFNIFSVMRAESDEVRTHSRIIAEFLNPKGLHNQGSVFLRLFFEEIKSLMKPLGIITDFDFENAQVLVEEHVGTINKEYSEGGFIDIVIKDLKNQIVIENKIYAGDQKGQLLRYKNNYPNCKLIYLTLNGKEPCQSSYKIENGQELNLKNDIMLASYSEHIKNWIEKSLEKTYSLPIIRETLVQYLHLIKKLTNQSTNNKMSKEIASIMGTNVRSSFEVAKNIPNMKLGLYLDFFENIKDYSVVENKCIKYDEDFLNGKDPDFYGVSFIPNGWENMPFHIDIAFEKKYYGLFIGIKYSKEASDEDKRAIEKKFENRYDKSPSYIWKSASKPNWADDPEIWEDIAKGKSGEIYKDTISIVEEILAIVNSQNNFPQNTPSEN